MFGRSKLLSECRLDDGDVLLVGASAHANASDNVAIAGQGNAAGHGGITTPGHHYERIERLARLYERDEVNRTHPHKRGSAPSPHRAFFLAGFKLPRVEGCMKRSRQCGHLSFKILASSVSLKIIPDVAFPLTTMVAISAHDPSLLCFQALQGTLFRP
jgi:hypothetical protein